MGRERQLIHAPVHIVRHAKENLAKCSLSGLEARAGLCFHTFAPLCPPALPPELGDALLLTLREPGGELARPLCAEDAPRALLLVDGTWRLADQILRGLEAMGFRNERRRLPPGIVTAYPRRQTGCPSPEAGLASVEALYASCVLTGRDTSGLLDGYRWGAAFLTRNEDLRI